jgi:3-hydroxyacyl-[acyl-carrier-protein] dehydratase
MIENHPIIISIKKTDDNNAIINTIFDDECDLFKGHFDNQAILPGIAQIDFTIKLASEIFEIEKDRFTDIPQAKFRKVILPNDNILITLKNANNAISFEYLLNGERASLGKIKYE